MNWLVLSVLAVVILGLLASNLLGAKQHRDLVEIQAQAAADRETLLIHAALAKTNAELVKLQTTVQPKEDTPRQAARAVDLRTYGDQIRRTMVEMGYDPDDVPDTPEGLG